MPALSMHVVVVIDVAMRLVYFEDEAHEDASFLPSVACASASFICLPRIFALTYGKVGSVYAYWRAYKTYVAHVHGGPLNAKLFALLILLQRFLKEPACLEHGRKVKGDLAVFRCKRRRDAMRADIRPRQALGRADTRDRDVP